MSLKRAVVQRVQRYVVNPIGRRVFPVQLETTGRRSGQPRRTAVGGHRDGDTFWVVSEHGAHADYVKNIAANPAVRIRLGGVWHTATATALPDDDPQARLTAQPAYNSTLVRLMGTDLLTIRIDLA